MLKPVSFLALIGMSAAFAPSLAPLRSSRSATSPRLAAVSGLRIARSSGSFPTFLPKEMVDIEDEACVAMAASLRRVPVTVASEFAVGPIQTSFTRTECAPAEGTAPVLMLHGFDSSVFEFRRLLPQLEERKIGAWAMDILGWGFTERAPTVSSFSKEAKRAHLKAFIEQEIKGPVTLLGASLGGSVAIDLAIHHPELVQDLILVDAQAYIDGAAMEGNPRFMKSLGVKVLKTEPLRMFANKIAYADPDTFGTPDAMRIGRLHTYDEAWEDSMVDFMESGGYRLSERVAEVGQRTTVLWGRQDKILDPSKYAQRFVDDLPNASLKWIEDCGHVPHLEQASVTADCIQAHVTAKVKVA
ncbi:Alpha/Beta hydrolase protein [Baffinella frigidus]|nr:Alpha/Beta hydrolase protein [Cryptophyta sp. CCMP2293]|mmetsp:Transcript_1055/g.2589  ORF Transcript_1055/g.2589 Transcript_1055/m.2589 type:complete len:357 (-) Transcript_1055:293-1363(-)